MLRPKVGDTVLFEAVVSSVNNVGFKINYCDTDVEAPMTFDYSRIKEVITRPFQVGDKVHVGSGKFIYIIQLIWKENWAILELTEHGSVPHVQPLSKLTRCAA